MNSNDTTKSPLDSIITKDYVETLQVGNKLLKELVADIEEKYGLLYNKKFDEALFVKEENLYFIDPSLGHEIAEAGTKHGPTTLDVVLEIYLGWVTRLSSQLIVNARHYNKNKVIKAKLDDYVLSIVPNAKTVSAKIDIFLDKAKNYFEAEERVREEFLSKDKEV